MKYEDTLMPVNKAEDTEEIKTEVVLAEYPEVKVRGAEDMDFSVLQSNLGNCLKIIDDEVMKGYLTDLHSAEIAPLEDDALNNMKDIQFFKITELVYEQNEFSSDKLSTVFHSLSGKPGTLVLMIKSNGFTNDFYFGVRPLTNNSEGTMRKLFENTLKGQFPGSKIESYRKEYLEKDMAETNADSITAVTCVADYKREKNSMSNKEFIQGLEKFVYSMQGKAFTAVFIADSVGYDELMMRKREYEEIYTQLSPFADMQLNFAVSSGESSSTGTSGGVTRSSSSGVTSGTNTNYGYSNAQTDGTSSTHGVTDTEGTSESVSDGKTHTTGTSDTKSKSVSDSHTDGTSTSTSTGTFGSVSAGVKLGKIFNIGGSVGTSSSTSHTSSHSDTHSVTHGKSHTKSVSDAVSKTLSHGTNRSNSVSDTEGTNSSTTLTQNYGGGTQSGTSYTVSNSFNLVNSETLSNNFGNTKGITLNTENMTIKSILERIKKHLDRFDECESMGMWNFAAYFLGDKPADTETAANTYRALMSGNRSGIERSASNTWTKDDNNNYNIDMLQKYVKNFIHPVFMYNRHTYDGNEIVGISPAALVSTNELAIHLSLPRHSVKGLPVTEHAVFGQEVLTRKDRDDERIVNLGKVYHLGTEISDTNVELDTDSLAMHTFITGSTGSGKSNAVFHILDKLRANKVPFLVIEPAKGEYGKFFVNANYYGTNAADGNILHSNPFAFPE
ncbi:MAG: DUF87 domain-containing protein, partial [Muribaculaceae bacterium]|nr:DUF87 domain-containing protein [Muribaculaceae bacterium]